MGWFDDQIEYRKKRELDILSDSVQNIAKSITGHRIESLKIDEGSDIKDAISYLLKYFNVKEREMPDTLVEIEDVLDFQLSAAGIMYREVILEKGWHADAMGAMIGTIKDSGKVIAILPGLSGGFYYNDPDTGKKITITRSVERTIGREAFCFYKPLPQRSLTVVDLLKFMHESLTTWDYVSFGASAAVITVIGMLLAKFNYILMGDVVKYDSHRLLAAVMMFMLCATIGSLMFTTVKQLLLMRISTKMSIKLNAAAMMRVLSLPSDFFRNYSSGELNKYLSYLNKICDSLTNVFLSTGITGLFSLVFLTQICAYARSLVIPSICVTLATLIISIISASMKVVNSKGQMQVAAKENGLIFSLINGIQKIRLSGAEKRAFAKWANIYAEKTAYTFNAPSLLRLNQVFTTAVSLIGTIIIYYVAVVNGVTVAEYYAFNASYAYIATAFNSLAAVAVTAGTIRPVFELIQPFMDAEPEIQKGKETVTQLSGGIEFSHVSFKYDQNGPLILDDLSITIPARQYVAIVGRTGCGKSTMMRLLLGFESPTNGSVFYDKKDMKGLDMRSVRKLTGTVMQDGRLFSGSIFENITISDPTLKLDDAWAAAEIAGIADDIRSMPMEMNTFIQEGAGGISGGQRQRLMIARAVAPKPKILLLDEATSALDNVTQKSVSDSLDKMKCTRIVIAHRLSTIKHCDRILVLDGGKIAEDGTYEELIEKNGIFAELVERQRVDI